MSESMIVRIIPADLIGVRTDWANVDCNMISNDNYLNVRSFCFSSASSASSAVKDLLCF
jgi:hypothetical protein